MQGCLLLQCHQARQIMSAPQAKPVFISRTVACLQPSQPGQLHQAWHHNLEQVWLLCA